MTPLIELLSPKIFSLGARSVAVLDATAQPSFDVLRARVPDYLIEGAARFSIESKQREWILSRILMLVMTGEIPQSGRHGELIWNGEFAGSLSHKFGHVAFAFGRSGHTYGVDLEACRDLEANVVAKIMTETEQKRMNDITPAASSAVFSAKEAIYKFLFPDVGRPFYFDAVELLDMVVADNSGVLMFRTTTDLSDAVHAEKLLRVDLIGIKLAGQDFWLTSARG